MTKFPVFKTKKGSIYYTIAQANLLENIGDHIPFIQEVRDFIVGKAPFYVFYGNALCIFSENMDEEGSEEDLKKIILDGPVPFYDLYSFENPSDQKELKIVVELPLEKNKKYSRRIGRLFEYESFQKMFVSKDKVDR